jgi:PAS domain S-box-containing protein
MGKTRYQILLVEDNELDRMAFKRFVEQGALPYDCTIAASVTEARGVLAERRFDAVVSDYSLGDGTAFDILNCVEGTPTILITGAGDQEVAVKAWKAGAYDYLIKDIDCNYLKTVPMTIENAIRHNKTEKKLQLLCGAVMSTDDSVYIADMEGRVIFVNRAFCETYGYSEEEIIGKDRDILWMGGRGGNTENGFRVGAAGSGWGTGFYHKRKDQSVFPVSLSRSGITDSMGHEVAVVGIARDISERILVEEELRTANEELNERCQQNSGLAVMVLEALSRSLADEQIERARSIADDFLTIARIEAGKMQLERDQMDFASLVRREVEQLSACAVEKDIELLSFLPDSELQINADCCRIGQAVRNLIKRAIASVRSGGHISVRVEDTDSQIAVRIEDDGAAITGSEMGHIFERSELKEQRFDREGSELFLGLPIAREMIEMHGGCLWAEYGDDRRNAVCFTLPKSRPQPGVHSPSVSSRQG